MNPPNEAQAPTSAEPVIIRQGHYGDEISLADIVAAFAARKWLIAALTLLFGTVGIIAAFVITPTYRAEIVVSPVEGSSSKSGLSALAGQLGGLASLAGVSLSGGGDKSEAIATLRSRALTENYIRQQDLLPILFAKKWDASNKQFYRNAQGKIPTLWDGNKLFAKEIRTVAEDKKTGLVTLGIEWEDPAKAAQWANDLVKLANQTLRDRAITESNRNLTYLNEQLGKTSVVELRQAIFRLIETEVKNVMVANGSEEYAFKVIDPAVIPEERFGPQRKLIVLLGFSSGLILSTLYALVRYVVAFGQKPGQDLIR